MENENKTNEATITNNKSTKKNVKEIIKTLLIIFLIFIIYGYATSNETQENIKLSNDVKNLNQQLSDLESTINDLTSKNELLREAIRKLNDREKNIMEMRFGFISGKEKTQKEVADELGISQSYISRLEKKIINKMKKDIMSKTG